MHVCVPHPQHVQELDRQVAALLQKNEEESKTVSRLKQALAVSEYNTCSF